jgi:hypothetical protein
MLTLPAHALQAEQVRLKSVGNEGHFTLEHETVFRRISPTIAVGLQSFHKVLAAHMLKAMQRRMNTVGNESHFTLEIETLFRPYLPYDCSGVTR